MDFAKRSWPTVRSHAARPLPLHVCVSATYTNTRGGPLEEHAHMLSNNDDGERATSALF